MNQYIITDIHGCCTTFKKLLKKIRFSKKDELYLLGDYIDRGPDSKGVIDHIWHLQKSGHTVHCLKGNHEQMMVDALTHESAQDIWFKNGGMETCNSFDFASGKSPDKYLDWMDSLPTYFEVGKYILVHAGLKFGVKNPLEDSDAQMWVRNWYHNINYNWLGDRYIVHGHTPRIKSDILKMKDELEERRVLNLDGGCVFGKEGYGELVCFEMGGGDVVFERGGE